MNEAATAPAVAQPVIDQNFVERHIQANPHDPGGWTSMGVMLRRNNHMDAAIACHYRALEIDPTFSAAWSNLGNALTDTGRHLAALKAHERAFALSPDTPSAAFNYAIGRRKAGRGWETMAMLERALALDPANIMLVWERALTRLQFDDYTGGFADYEVRYHIPTYKNRLSPGRKWDGSPLQGRTIFLSTEQGFGDALLMSRYVPLVKARGGRIILECHNELRRVLSGLDTVDEFVEFGAPFPAYDVHASLMSLPGLFATTPRTVPRPVSITVPADARAKAASLVPADDRLKVGIVWSGRVTFGDNHRRATTLARFLRFADVPGVRLYSVQKGEPEAQLQALGTNHLVTALGPHLDDFAVTAAVLERLDLVIMTDSSVAHLAASLGRPVWNLMQYVPYWIYGIDGERTPWYPTMRLFRQGIDEDWDPVFARVRAELVALRQVTR